jgi:hypothetical protein
MIDAVLNTRWLSWNRTRVQRAIQACLDPTQMPKDPSRDKAVECAKIRAVEERLTHVTLQTVRSASGFVTRTGFPSRKASAFSMLCP